MSDSRPDDVAAVRDDVRGVASTHTGRTVLVVEDLEPLGKLADVVLRRAGYDVLLVDHPHGALRVAERATRIDVLLTDVVMPDMSGRELAARLRTARPGLPVVYMTGYATSMDELGSDTSRTQVLSKPFAAAELVTMIARAVDGPSP